MIKIYEELQNLKDTKKVSIEKKNSPLFTHILTAYDEKGNPIKKVLYNDETKSIFREETDFIKPEKEDKFISYETIYALHKDDFHKAVTRAVLSTIGAHGDITKGFAVSAAKRITGELFSEFKKVNTLSI